MKCAHVWAVKRESNLAWPGDVEGSAAEDCFS